MRREEAWSLLNEYTKKSSLIKHGLAVEAAMRGYAKKFGEDEELWGVMGLIHDFDYEKYPSEKEHPYKGGEILRERGVSEEFIRVVMSHAAYTGIPRDSLAAKTLFAVDELCGFIMAVAMVRPDKKLEGVKVKSVKKKLKSKGFAAGVNRDEIKLGVEELGVELDRHIEFVIDTLKERAEMLGL